jgi:hypothetical protein
VDDREHEHGRIVSDHTEIRAALGSATVLKVKQ